MWNRTENSKEDTATGNNFIYEIRKRVARSGSAVTKEIFQSCRVSSNHNDPHVEQKNKL